jgi:hypothetical protein
METHVKNFEQFLESIKQSEIDQTITEKKFSKEKRDELAKQGKAMEDGSFPIENAKDLENAIRSHGRSKHPNEVKKHIQKRAKALGLYKTLPDTLK